ncbi:MAG TPA: hypothetical protein VGK81_05970 [Anaerolineae bacterium]|jgi:hypothetical protein
MSIDTIKQLAIGLLCAPTRTPISEPMLTLAVRSAIAMYSTLRPLQLCSPIFMSAGASDVDEKGPYMQLKLPVSSGILTASMISINGDHYQYRVFSVTSTDAYIAAYGFSCAPEDPVTVAIWHPAAHDPDNTTWPLHHEALIAHMAASYFLNAIAINSKDSMLSDSLQNIASAYYGRATTTLTQIP